MKKVTMKNYIKDNINFVHAHHYPALTEETMRRLKEENIKIKMGDYIKTAFKDGDNIEHMWIKVEGVLDSKICGRLDSIPILVRNVEYGQLVTVDLSTITGYMNKEGVVIHPVLKHNS